MVPLFIAARSISTDMSSSQDPLCPTLISRLCYENLPQGTFVFNITHIHRMAISLLCMTALQQNYNFRCFTLVLQNASVEKYEELLVLVPNLQIQNANIVAIRRTWVMILPQFIPYIFVTSVKLRNVSRICSESKSLPRRL